MSDRLPVSIRNKNPGAMWPGPASREFGSETYEQLGDGNKAATFSTNMAGAAALFYLLHRTYRGLRVDEAIKKWSGGNNVNSYLRIIESKTSTERWDYIDDEFLADPATAVPFAKAMAWHEAGMKFPMPDSEWKDAHYLYTLTVKGLTPEDLPPVQPARGKPVLAHLEWVKSKLGEEELKGAQHNEFIVQCFADVGHAWVQDDETAWCAAFVGAALKHTGSAHTGALDARSYLNYGEKLDEPEEGAIVTFWRVHPDDWRGHVAVVESWDEKTITYIGGNQSDKVSRLTAPRVGPKSKVLGYRRAIPVKAPVSEVVATDSVKYKSVGLLALVSAWFHDTIGWGVASVASGLTELMTWIGLFPEAASEATKFIAPLKSLEQSAGVPWPVYASITIAGVALLYNLHSTWKRKRNRMEVDTDKMGDLR
jgi:uncharacterized protein (TIGR02594 family)